MYNGSFKFFSPTCFSITYDSLSQIVSDPTIQQENSINAECRFLKTQGITTFSKKNHGQF